jgi:hypothetical protein
MVAGAYQNQVKTLSWKNSGKSNLTPPKGKVLATALAPTNQMTD